MLFIYFLFCNWNFILQVFEDLDKMCRKKLEITGQKMSKKDQEKRISAVRKQISQLQLRVQKLESILHTLRTNPDYYFENLNTKNRVCRLEKQIWKQGNKENKSSNEAEEEERGATASTGGADNFLGFFFSDGGFFHSAATSVLMWGASRSSSSSYGHTALSTTHPTHVLLGAVCPLPHWAGYFPRSLMVHHLTSLHVILFMKAMLIIVCVVIVISSASSVRN